MVEVKGTLYGIKLDGGHSVIAYSGSQKEKEQGHFQATEIFKQLE